MSRQFRYRMAALVASGVLFGVPLLSNGTANADQLEPGDRRVTFGGGVLGLSCGSKPSVEKMTVPADSTLHVINRTGHDARLELAGSSKGVIPDDGAAEVLFRRGTTPVLLTPDCSGADTPVPILVTAVPSAPATLPNPGSGGSNAVTLPSIVAGSSGHSSASGSTLPGNGSQRSRPARRSPDATGAGLREPGDDRTAAETRIATSAAAASPQGRAHSKIKTKGLRTSDAGTPAFAGMPPGERKTLVPADRASVTGMTSANPVVPASEEAPAADSDDLFATDLGTDAESPAAAPAAEPVAAVGPLRTGRPIGLLGLTAMVCALGVLTAAIRAIVSQRASRANLA